MCNHKHGFSLKYRIQIVDERLLCFQIQRVCLK